MSAKKKNPRPPERSPLQPAPSISCPQCQQPILLPPHVRYGTPVDLGRLETCNHCDTMIELVRVAVAVHWQWEVYKP